MRLCVFVFVFLVYFGGQNTNNVRNFVSTRLEMRVPEGVQPENDIQYLYQHVLVSTVEFPFPNLQRRAMVTQERRVWP